MKRVGDIERMIETLKRRETRAIAKFKPIYRKRIEELQQLKEHSHLPKFDKLEKNDSKQLH